MNNNKVYIRKEGAVHTVYEDVSSGKPLPLSSFDDSPPGGLLQTFMSLREVLAKYPGREVICLEKPRSGTPQVLKRSETVRAQAAAIVDALPKKEGQPSKSQMKRLNVQQGRPQDEGVYPKLTKEVLSEQMAQVFPENDARKLHAEEFLKRLEVAREYASAKNRRLLDIQIKVIHELLGEVFE